MGSGYRGRLIWPMIAEIAILDTLATSQPTADNDAEGGVSSGYHPIFREPRLVPPANQETAAGAPRGESTRAEKLMRLKAQWEVENFDFQQQWASGPSPSHRIGLVLHFRELEKKGLIDDDGAPLIKVNDRLVAIYHKKTGKLIQRFRSPPNGTGLYVTEVPPMSIGLSGHHRNILLLILEDRERSVRRA